MQGLYKVHRGRVSNVVERLQIQLHFRIAVENLPWEGVVGKILFNVENNVKLDDF